MAILTKAIYRFKAAPIVIPFAFLKNTSGKVDPKIHMELQGTLNSENYIEKEKQKDS